MELQIEGDGWGRCTRLRSVAILPARTVFYLTFYDRQSFLSVRLMTITVT